MGACVSKQQYNKNNQRRYSDNAPTKLKENKECQLVNSSSVPAVYNSGSSDGGMGHTNIDQIALNFAFGNNGSYNSAAIRHSYPNTPKVSAVNSTINSSNSVLLNNVINSPHNTAHNNSIASPNSTVTDDDDFSLINHSMNNNNHSKSFSNSSTPRIGTLNGSGLSHKSMLSQTKRFSITETNNNNNNNIPSTYLTSVTGPDIQKPVNYTINDDDLLIALFDYNARDEEEVSLRKSDILKILDDPDDDWILIENISSRMKGYVPKVYVARKGSYEAEDWFFKSISRKDSERLLLLRGNIEGTFLIRGSETDENQLSLSIHHVNTVSHYRVRHQLDYDEEGFFITRRHVFRSLQHLVDFYSSDANGLCCKLTRPCPRPPPVTSDLSRRTRDRWEISRTSVDFIKKLGSGNFGDVFQGKWNGTTDVAVKTMKPGTMPKDEFLKEARIMKKLSHPNLVRLYAVCSDDPVYIVTELMSKGSLIEYLRGDEGHFTSLKELVNMMGQIANGMSYLEKEGYIHRDLAARNILIGDGNICKVADFGLTRIVQSSSDIYNAKQGTKFPIKWTAPEAALVGKFTVKSDVWSYGIVLYEIITHGQIPYPTMNNTETLKEVERGYRMICPPNCPKEIYKVMLDCWDMFPEKRPTFGALSDFFNDNSLDDCCTKYRPSLGPTSVQRY